MPKVKELAKKPLKSNSYTVLLIISKHPCQWGWLKKPIDGSKSNKVVQKWVKNTLLKGVYSFLRAERSGSPPRTQKSPTYSQSYPHELPTS